MRSCLRNRNGHVVWCCPVRLRTATQLATHAMESRAELLPVGRDGTTYESRSGIYLRSWRTYSDLGHELIRLLRDTPKAVTSFWIASIPRSLGRRESFSGPGTPLIRMSMGTCAADSAATMIGVMPRPSGNCICMPPTELVAARSIFIPILGLDRGRVPTSSSTDLRDSLSKRDF